MLNAHATKPPEPDDLQFGLGRLLGSAFLAGLLAVPGLWLRVGLNAQSVPPAYVCFPTCDNDGRLLAVRGAAQPSLADPATAVSLFAPLVGGNATMAVGIFDGDNQGDTSTSSWDTNGPAGLGDSPILKFEFYDDPLGNGGFLADGSTPQARRACLTSDGSNGPCGAADNPDGMLDNDWSDYQFTVAGAPPAASGSGLYRAVLRITATDSTGGINAFKLRTTDGLALPPQSFLFVAPENTASAAQTAALTTYDGSWQLDFLVPVTGTIGSVSVWDGDFGYGDSACTALDTDDPDTPGLPPFPTAATVAPQGIAIGQNVDDTLDPLAACVPGAVRVPAQAARWTTGTRASAALSSRTPMPNGWLPFASVAFPKFWNPTAGAILTTPLEYAFPPQTPTLANVVYIVKDPDGREYLNDNPSGTNEWEKFTIASPAAHPAFTRSTEDYFQAINGACGSPLCGGTYGVRVYGVEVNHPSAWHATFPTLGVSPDHKSVEPEAVFSVEGFVFQDANTNGVRDVTESWSGPPVTIELLDGVTDAVLDRTMTASGALATNGRFSFRAKAGTYRLRVPTADNTAELLGAFHTTVTLSGLLTVGGGVLSATASFGYSSNQPPVANPDTITLPHDARLAHASTTIDVVVSGGAGHGQDVDPDGDPLAVTATSNGVKGTTTFTGNNVTYTAGDAFLGSDAFTYTIADVVDGHAVHSTQGSVTVVEANASPVAANDSYTTSANVPLTIPAGASSLLANDTDADGDSLLNSVVLVGAPSSGALTLGRDGSFSYTPAQDFVGTVTFTYTVNDGRVDSAAATVTISVTAPNPIAGALATVTNSVTAPNPIADALADVNNVVPFVGATLLVDRTSANPGDTVAYTLTYTNLDSADATDVRISFPVPDRTTFGALLSGGTQTGGVVTWLLGTVPAGGVRPVTLTLTLSSVFPAGSTSVTMTGQVTSRELPTPTPSATAVTTVVQQASTVTSVALTPNLAAP